MKSVAKIVALLSLFVFMVLGVHAEPTKPVFTELYYDDGVVRTVVPPAKMTKPGKDDIYVVPNQRPVAAVAPGAKGYHGGKWAVNIVEWINAPYLLTSADDVADAYEAGDIMIARMPGADFKCPIQP